MSQPNTDVLDEILETILSKVSIDFSKDEAIKQEAKVKIQELYVLKSDVEKAIGEDENSLVEEQYATSQPTVREHYRNELRAEIRAKLDLKTEER